MRGGTVKALMLLEAGTVRSGPLCEQREMLHEALTNYEVILKANPNYLEARMKSIRQHEPERGC